MEISEEKNILRRGIGIGNGCVGGPLWFFKRAERKGSKNGGGSIDEERARLHRAIAEVKGNLEKLVERAKEMLGEEQAEIFEIHGMLLEDEDLNEGMEAELAQGAGAEDAVERAAKRCEDQLLGIEDPYLCARAKDIEDIARQLLNALSGDSGETWQNPCIVVADELSPSETVTLDKSKILGFVTFGGSPNSHASILARAMGIPALVGIGALSPRFDGAYALLDAAEGSLTVLPDEKTKATFEKKQRRMSDLEREHEKYLRSLLNKPAITRSGRKILIYANVASGEEAEAAYLNGADGIGLLRTELLYLSKDSYPDEEELFESYRDMITKMGGKRIVIRTLDIGADKQASYFDLPQEENPFYLRLPAHTLSQTRRERTWIYHCPIKSPSTNGRH